MGRDFDITLCKTEDLSALDAGYKLLLSVGSLTAKRRVEKGFQEQFEVCVAFNSRLPFTFPYRYYSVA